MENTSTNATVATLLEKAKVQMAEDMKTREIGAIIWSLPAAGFHFMPEIKLPDGKVVRVTGLYHYNGELFAIEEDVAGVSVNQFYNKGIDVPPMVVTLSESKAGELFGNPEMRRGFTSGGNLDEWLTIADCYFEALRES